MLGPETWSCERRSGKAPRPTQVSERDLRCLVALRGPAALREEPWRSAASVLRSSGAIDRDKAPELAARLDPLGLDVALAWLGMLVRAGEGEKAHAATERLLAEVS